MNAYMQTEGMVSLKTTEEKINPVDVYIRPQTKSVNYSVVM